MLIQNLANKLSQVEQIYAQRLTEILQINEQFVFKAGILLGTHLKLYHDRILKIIVASDNAQILSPIFNCHLHKLQEILETQFGKISQKRIISYFEMNKKVIIHFYIMI